MTAELILDSVSVTRGRTPVLHDVSTRFRPGHVHGIIGLNGAGKSTLFQAILGLVPHSGEITFGARPVDPAQVGATINGPAFYPRLTARGNLRVHTLLTGTDPARIDPVLRTVGLDPGGPRAGAFSTGMTVRLALAMALLTDPAVLILDEPQNGLDPQGIRDLRVLVRRLADAGTVVLLSSHHLGEVSRMVDDIGVLAGGRLVYDGPLTDCGRPGENLEDAVLRLSHGDVSGIGGHGGGADRDGGTA